MKSGDGNTADRTRRHQWRVLTAGSLAHVTHDGFAGMLYLFFPIWQSVFGLNFTQVGFLKSLFSGGMSVFQMPAGILAGRIGILKVLTVGSILTSLALFGTSLTSSPVALGLLLALGGIGSSTQHPLSSTAISNSFGGKASRVALSTYNFIGDIGKLIFPLFAAMLITRASWEQAIGSLGLCGLAGTALVFFFLSGMPVDAKGAERTTFARSFSFLKGRDSLPFLSLSAIGVIDGVTRSGFLTFLPFLFQARGADMTQVALALSLIFGGGAAGKFVCGAAATRVGILRIVILTEAATALCILGTIALPVNITLLLCPLLGIMLNGTSSVLYGSVPELVPAFSRNEAFAFFYTCSIGAGAIAPFFYGLLSDGIGLNAAMTAVALCVLATIPLTGLLRGKVGRDD